MARWQSIVAVLVLLVWSSTLPAAAPPGISLVGKGVVSGTALDKSGLTGTICQTSNTSNCIPKALFGGFGSAIAYTGHDDVYLAVPDRGPFDGLTTVPYFDRVHFLHMTLNLGAAFPNIHTLLLDTRFLKNEFGQQFYGAAGAFNVLNPLATLRLDPEGIRASGAGTFYVSDEYGPYLFEFDRQGHLLNRLPVPSKYFIANPSADPNSELLNNTSGRQANRGMEGLAISPDGGTLFGLMQNALLQDNALTPGTTNRVSVNTRLLVMDVETGQTREYVYVLEASNRGQGTNEILAINDHQFLVVERDNRSWLTTGEAPTRKKIWKIDTTGATDVSGIASLPATGLPAGVVAVAKSLFIDMLDPDFGLHLQNADAIAEKIEGLTWGPDLPDGRHVLYVTSDNDVNPNVPTQIFAFAIDGAVTGVNPAAQTLPGPMFAPGLLQQALGR